MRGLLWMIFALSLLMETQAGCCWMWCRCSGKKDVSTKPKPNHCDFTQYDTNGDSVITADEFESFVQVFKADHKGKGFAVFGMIDKDDNGLVTKAEFNRFMPLLMKVNGVEKCPK